MDFSSFPMDQQTCQLTLESFNYNNQEVDMRWLNTTDTPLSLLKDEILLPDFVLTNYSTYLKHEVGAECRKGMALFSRCIRPAYGMS